MAHRLPDQHQCGIIYLRSGVGPCLNPAYENESRDENERTSWMREGTMSDDQICEPQQERVIAVGAPQDSATHKVIPSYCRQVEQINLLA